MNLAGLRTFLAIVETGSLVRASQRLNVTQSTVTARLKGLEDSLGQRLLHREKSGVQLTSAGAKFKRYAEAINNLWRQARQETALPTGIETVCNLGCHMDLWPDLGRRFFNEVYRTQKTAALSAWPGDKDDMTNWLASGLIDAALTYHPATRDGQTTRPLRTERLILVSTRLGTSMRADPLYVYVDAGEEFGRRHVAAYSDAGTAKLSFGCAVWAVEHLMENHGSAYLPDHLAGPHLDSGKFYPIPDAPVFSRTAFLVTNDAAVGNWGWLREVIEALTG